MPPTIDNFSTDSEEEEYTLDEGLESILGDAAMIMIYPSVLCGDEEGYGIPDKLLVTYWTRLHGKAEKIRLTAAEINALIAMPQFTQFPGVFSEIVKPQKGGYPAENCATVFLNQEHISVMVLEKGHDQKPCKKKTIPEGWAVLQVHGGGIPDGKGEVSFLDKRNSKTLGFVPLHDNFKPLSASEESWEVFDTQEEDGRVTFVNQKFSDELYEDSEIPREPSKNPAKPATPTGPTGVH